MTTPHKVLEQHYHLVAVLRSIKEKRKYLASIIEQPDRASYRDSIAAKIKHYDESITVKQSELNAHRAKVDDLFTPKGGG